MECFLLPYGILREKSLFAARDRFGVKPFYYSENTEGFYFASEIKSLTGVLENNEPSLKSMGKLFLLMDPTDLPNETFFQDIFQLPAGHFLNL